jgi:class 3 adenylate cyclase/pimeloyl-ACP methyl ester carboxylesterase
MEQQIGFCTSADGTRIAYATYGDAPGTPLVLAPFWGVSQEFLWKLPEGRTLLEELARGRKLVTFDRRGMGGSQREIDNVGLDAQVADLAAGVDHLRLAPFHLFAAGSSAAACVAYAARRPERVGRLVLFGPFLRGADATSGGADALIELIRASWPLARRSIADLFFPSGPDELRKWTATCLRESMSPESAARFLEFSSTVDVVAEGACLQAPALLLHRRGDRAVPVSAGRAAANVIPDARLIVLEGDASYVHDHGQFVGLVREFLDEGDRPPSAPVPAPSQASPPTLVTILFTDIEDSTAQTQRLGDAQAQDLVHAHNAIVREALTAHGGSEIKHTGDGIMASFPSASRAIECAVAIQRAVARRNQEPGTGNKDASVESGIQPPASSLQPLGVHVGLNAGEPVAEGGDLFGTAVQLARRICDASLGGEIMVSDVVRQLSAGKGFLFADRGAAALKGFEDPVRLYEVRWQAEGSP